MDQHDERQPHTAPRVSAMVFDQPWAILPSRLEAMCDYLDRRAEGAHGEPYAAAPVPLGRQANKIAVVPVFGVLAHRANLMTQVSGGTSTELLGRQLRALDQDPDVSTIVLDIDSPGGEVFGTEELAAQIRGMRTRVVAQANAVAASAAFWLASQADEVVMTPSGEVGSIGVIAQHVDATEAEASVGIRRTLVTAGEGKADGLEPITDESRARLQAQVDRFYGAFVDDVVRGRNASFAALDGRTAAGKRRITSETVIAEWKAQMFTSERALEAGLVDRVADLDATIAAEVERVRVAGQDRLRQRRAARAKLGV